MSIDIVIPSNPKDLQDLKSEIQSCVESMIRVSAEKEYIKETVNALSEKFEINKKYINKLIRAEFKQDIDKTVMETQSLDELYTAINNIGK